MARRALLGLVVALVAGTGAGLGLTPAPAGAAPCRSADQQVAIVVDFGDGQTRTATCVGLASRATGLDALTARSDQLGTARVRVENGLVCAIDGYPATGCGDPSGSGTYSYWSYWKGDGSNWAYASVGATSRARAATVEGWHFLTKSQEGGATPPAASPDPAATCRPVATAPPTTAAPPAGGGTTAPPAPDGGGGAAPRRRGSTTVAPAPPAPGATSSSAPAGDSTSSTASTTIPERRRSESAARTPVVTVSADDDGGGGSPVGLLVGLGGVAALGAGAAVLARRRGPVG